MNHVDISKFRGNDENFEAMLPTAMRSFDLHNIAERGALATCPDDYRETLLQELEDTRQGMYLLLNALPELVKNHQNFRTYQNAQVSPRTEGFLYDWGRIRVCLHANHADTTGMSHAHHTGYGNETAPVAALQIQTRAELMMEISHRIIEAHGGAYLFMIDNVWNEKTNSTHERAQSNMCNPRARARSHWMPVREDDFFALGSKTQHNVARKGIVPNFINPLKQRCLSVFMMLIKPERSANSQKHDLPKKERVKLWDDITKALSDKKLI